MHVSDYTETSLLDILNDIKATVLVSLLHDNNPNVMVKCYPVDPCVMHKLTYTLLVSRYLHKLLC